MLISVQYQHKADDMPGRSKRRHDADWAGCQCKMSYGATATTVLFSANRASSENSLRIFE